MDETQPYDAIFTAAMHEVEQRALVLERSAVLTLVDVERQMRHAIRHILSHYADYRDGWIDPLFMMPFIRYIHAILDDPEHASDVQGLEES